MTSTTQTVVVGVLADLNDALATGRTGSFDGNEIVAVRDKLRAVVARQLPERTYNARARLLLAGLCDVALARDLDATRACPLAQKIQEAIDALRTNNLGGV